MKNKAILVKTRGEKWQSTKYRPTLFVTVEPDLEHAKEVLRLLTYKLQELIVGIKDTPWWLIRPCEHCLRRVKAELNNSSMWQRRMCLRHYVLHMLEFKLWDNKEHMFYARLEPLDLVVHGGSNNYRYVLVLTEHKATLTLCGFKYYGKKFTYRRHLNAYPLLSSYDYILKFILDTVIPNVEDLLREIERSDRDYELVLVS